jgi:hypothetical protein
MVQLPGGCFITTVRLNDKKVRTTLCGIDPDKRN